MPALRSNGVATARVRHMSGRAFPIAGSLSWRGCPRTPTGLRVGHPRSATRRRSEHHRAEPREAALIRHFDRWKVAHNTGPSAPNERHLCADRGHPISRWLWPPHMTNAHGRFCALRQVPGRWSSRVRMRIDIHMRTPLIGSANRSRCRVHRASGASVRRAPTIEPPRPHRPAPPPRKHTRCDVLGR